ncbi:MAG: HesA/MoeB/ThiF family protein [Pseudomonadota bacterium]
MLSSEEIERYQRHLVLKEIGGAGQQKLKKTKVLVVGAGGLGSSVVMYLAAAGIGTIGIIDDDTVSLSNLQRQVIYTTTQTGRSKVDSAAKFINMLNPHVHVVPISEKLDAHNALKIISDYDIVADGSDNFKTRYLVNDACYLAKRPLVFAAVGPFDGQLTTFKSYEKNEKGLPNPNYRCLFPEDPTTEDNPNCEQVGILGSVVGVMGSMQATEVLKESVGIGQSLVGRLLIFDAKMMRFETMTYGWAPDNPLNGKLPIYKDLSHFL